MSSREIENLNLEYGKLSLLKIEQCDKRHDHVCRDIENLNETYEKIPLPKVGQGYYTTHNTGNQQHREYLLTKEHRNVLADIRTLCEPPNRCANFSAHLFGGS